jgi:hypothetical protein
MAKAKESASGRPTEEAIAKRAYELFLQRGSVPGYELDDWLAAEAELTAAAADELDPSERESADATSGDAERETRSDTRRSSSRERHAPRRSLRT